MSSLIEFRTEDGTLLRGNFYRQDTASPQPVIVMAHGFSGLRSALNAYAEGFYKAGFNVVLFDNRGFGDSEGVRQHIDPHQQVADFRDAITFAQTLAGVDPERVGIWGSSYAGGHVIVIGANDRRVTAVVSQIPFVSGHANVPLLYSPDKYAELRRLFVEERRSIASGNPPRMMPVFSTSTAELCALPPVVTEKFIKASADVPGWKNEVTIRSVEFFGEYEPGNLAPLVSPTPLLMVIGAKDVVNPPELSLRVFESALEPKKVVIHPGGHFQTYTKHFDITFGAALDWFKTHLHTPPTKKK
jgi:fermentation-respiration switch protein FrsA (DUF1100 family)